MSRHSDYAGVNVDTPAAALRARSIDPATWSLACLVGRHSECLFSLDSPRNRGHAAEPCQCDTPGCNHQPRTTVRSRRRAAATTR